jgi:CHAT domain-containing protein/tetratricopeptide (TPR) repeat protein
MDTDLFLQHLRDLPLEEGRTYIQEHILELSDHAAIGNLLADEALRMLYTPFLSLKLAELLIFFGEYVHHTSSHALGLKAKGDVLMMIGHYQAALDALDAAGKEFKLLGDEGNWARSRISWIVSAAWLGRVEEALHTASQAREVFLRLGENFWVCSIDHNTAMIDAQIGRYQEAHQLYESMRDIYRTVTDQNETTIQLYIALAEMNQAIDLGCLGNFEQAYLLQQQALGGLVALEETYLIVNAEENLGDLDYMRGFYGSALRHYYQGCDRLIQSTVDDPLLLANLKLGIANCLVKLNRTQEAYLMSEQAVKAYRQVGISLSTGNALCKHASALIASGRLEEALAVLEEAWTLFSHSGFEHYTSTIRLQQAELLLVMDSTTAAYDNACSIKEHCEAQGLVAHAVRAGLVMSGALLAMSQQLRVDQEQRSTLLQKAEMICKHTIAEARQHNLQESIYKGHYLLGRLFVLQDNPEKAARRYRAAIAHIERILDDLVYDLSPSFLHSTWTVYEEMIALCLQQAQVEHAFSYLERARSMALHQYLNKTSALQGKSEEQQGTVIPSVSQTNSAQLLRIQQELKNWQEKYRDYSVILADIDTSVSPTVDRAIIHDEMKRCEAEISELFERLYLYESGTTLNTYTRKHTPRQVQEVDLVRLRQQLSPDQLLLTYFLYKGKLVIFAATTKDLVTHEIAGGMEQLESLLPLLHAHLDPRGWPVSGKPSSEVVRRLLTRLYNILVRPVANLLPSPSGLLTIVPYGPLHKLPFHALYDGSRFLVENFQVNYLPASSLLQHFDSGESQLHHRSADTSVVGKKPLVIGYSDNGHLQRVKDEAQSISTLLNGTCFLESEATIARLIKQAPGSPIIHLATHGQSRLDAPNFSYVRLADGQLNAIDAFSLDLRACELVTLSGCETGLALSGGGDEQLGLGRAFLAAGTSSLVISLWPVEDTATNELMKLFYQCLLQGESKVQALRAAQCQLMQDANSNYAHPYFWAAFRLVGDPTPLKTQKAKASSITSATDTLKKEPLSVPKI